MSDHDDEKAAELPLDGAPESSSPSERGQTVVVPAPLPSETVLQQGVGEFAAIATIAPGKAVRYIDFGFTSIREFWKETAEAAYERFDNDPTRGNAIMASLALSSLPDWLWHEQHPGEDTRQSKGYGQFRQQLLSDCPELAWVRDVADAGKHRGLGRSDVQVREAAKTWPHNTQPLKITLDNGSEHDIADVLHDIVAYFRREYFP